MDSAPPAPPPPGRRRLSVVITGASSGVGRALALRLAGEGHALFLVGRNAGALQAVADEAAAAGAASVATGVGDVASSEDVARIWQRWGAPTCDALVANAGLNRPGLLHEVTEDDFDAVMGTNVKGVWLWMRAVLPGMRAAGRGQVVVTSSVLGLRAPGGPGGALYCASKHALQGLVAAARVELAGTGVKVATVNPAAIATPWWSDPSRGGRREGAPPVDTAGMLPPEVVAGAIADLLHQHPAADAHAVVIDNAKPAAAAAVAT